MAAPLALTVIAALAGLSYAWAMGEGTLEYYYGAAVRSMSMNWHDFIFGAFDPAGTVTLDKLPGAFWFQVLSVRAFGFHPWTIVLPQVIEGIVTVLVLYRAVRRLAGPAAGLIAALVLAISPAVVALDRGNISDTLMILLLVLAADAVSAAIARGSAFPLPGPAAERLLHRALGRDTGWLIPAAAVIALWGLVSRRRQPCGDPLRACFILWGGWLVTLFAVFSAITTLNTYYTAALAPPAAALIGAGAAAAWSQDRAAAGRRIGLAVVVAGTAAYAILLVPSSGVDVPGWLVPAIVAVAVIAWSLFARRDTWIAAAMTASLIALALAPAAATARLRHRP